MKQIVSFLLITVVLYVASCDKGAYAPEYNDWPVIEGYLFAGKTVSVHISRQVSSAEYIDQSSEDINALKLTITDITGAHELTSKGDGWYINEELVIEEGREYTLEFSFNDKRVVATTQVLSSPTGFTQSVDELSLTKIDSNTVFSPETRPQQNDPVELTWDNNDNTYYMVVAQNTEVEPELIRDTSDDRFPSRVFRNEPGIINEYQMRDQQFLYFGNYLLLLYHLNPDYAALYNDNNNSSQNLTNPSTNITNGYGIFTGISSDTLYLNVKKSN